MSGFGGAVKLTGESEYKRALKEITMSLREVSAEMKVVTATFGRNNSSVTALTAKQMALTAQFREQTKKLNLLQDEYDNMSSEYDVQKKKHQALVDSYDKEKDKLEQIGKELGTDSEEYKEQQKVVDALEKEVRQSTAAQDANEASMSKMRVEISKATAEVNKTAREIGELEDELEQARLAESKTATESEKLATTISSQERDVALLKAAYKDAVLQYGQTSTEAKTLAKQIETLSSDLSDNKSKMAEVDHAADALDKSLDDVGDSAENASDGFTTFKATMANVIAQGIQKVTSAITGQMDAAISRVDTIHGFEKTMKALGFTEEDVAKSMDKLKDGIDGLPTTLPQVVSMQQQYTALTNDVDKATALTLALNDATVASGKGQEEAARAAEHWYSMLASGKPELENWKEANAIMPAQMKQLAQSILGTSATSQDLFKAWQSGKVSTEEIMDALIQLDTKGGKGVASFAKQAKDGSSGINTSMTNIKTAITNGIAQVIEEVGYDNIVAMFEAIKSGIKAIIPAMVRFTKAVMEVMNFVKDNSSAIIATITGITAAMVTLFIVGGGILKMVAAMKAWAIGLKIVKVAQLGLNAVMAANPIGLIVAAIVGLVAAFVILWKKSETFRNFWIALWGTIKKAASIAKAHIVGQFNVLVSAFNALKDVAVRIATSIASAWNWIVTKTTEMKNFVVTAFENLRAGIVNKITAARNSVRTVFESIRATIASKISSAKTAVSDAVEKIKGYFSFSGLAKKVGDTFNKIKEKITSPINSAKETVSNAVKKLSGFFPIHIGKVFSGLKIPHFKLLSKGKAPFGILGKGSLPKWDVSWYAKGGVINQPSLIGAGEDGAEAVVPLEKNTKWIKRVADSFRTELLGNRQSMSANTVQALDYDLTVDAFKEALADMEIILDDEKAGRFVEKTVTRLVYA